MTTAIKPELSTAVTGPMDGMPSMLAYLTRVLKIPTIGETWAELAEQAHDQNWSHEEYLAALLQRQVADRESKGTMMWIRTAHFPQVKTLEDFNRDHLPSLRRDVLAHLATGTFVAKAENVILLGPPGIGKTHLAIGLGVKATRPAIGPVRHRQQLDRPPRDGPPGRPPGGRAEEDPPLQVDHY
ncbi:ATP-binding protein [Streptomyces erythrochromogenes]|uniref:ATP-binding protein n=1 Tax=Streptomyces erythrochromogenes TaxID=285574 RepID=UPI003691DC89